MSAGNSVTSSELVEAVLSSLPTVGHGMGLDRRWEAVGCTAFAVKDPPCPNDSLVQEHDLFSNESYIFLSFTGFSTSSRLTGPATIINILLAS